MNNGTYLTLMDIGRVDMTAALRWPGAAVAARLVPGRRRRVDPVPAVAAARRAVRARRRGCSGWDERIFYLAQSFERPGRSGTPEVVADAWVVARFLRRTGGTVPASEVAAAFGAGAASPRAARRTSRAGPGRSTSRTAQPR